MKKCLTCDKNIYDERGDLCETCKDFLEWKHQTSSQKKLKQFKKFLKRDQDFNSIKLKRRKK